VAGQSQPVSRSTQGVVHHAGRRDQADDERAIERGRQGDSDNPASWDRVKLR